VRFLNPAVAVFAICSLLAFTAAAQPDVVNIANALGATEVTYSDVRGWDVTVGSIKGKPAYCVATSRQDGAELRLGFDGGQWQIAVPARSKRGEFSGFMTLDGRRSGTAGVSDGAWTFLWLNMGERDALMKGKMVVFEVGKASLDYKLHGAAAAALKVEECVERRVTASVAAAGRSPAPVSKQAGSELHRRPYPKIGDWEITRFTKDAAGKTLDHCEAYTLTGSEQGVRLTISRNSSAFGFAGLGSAAIGNKARITYWINGDKASSSTTEARLENDLWMMISERNDQPGMLDDAIPNARRISFSYPVSGKTHVETFTLKSSNKVVDQLIACRDGR
jgi:hypothetical protein